MGLQQKKILKEDRYLQMKLDKLTLFSYYQEDFLIPNNKPLEARDRNTILET